MMAHQLVMRLFSCAALLFCLCNSSPLAARAPVLDKPDTFNNINRSRSLQWQACSTGFSCAILDVPLDYSKPSGARAYVPLLRVPATTGPSKGIVFFNPGGPGISAIDWYLSYGSKIPSIIGTDYDVVIFEPRGVGFSLPNADCAAPSSQVLKRSYYQAYGPRLSPKIYQDEYIFQQSLGSACAKAIGGINQVGQYMSTAVVVKDIISILDAYAASPYSAGVANPKNFNYWGLSYGTIIGQTFAQLYSSRVGRFVLDGVTDAEDYYAGDGYKNVQLADLALSKFFEYCAKAGFAPPFNPSGCAFWNSTSQAIFERFEKLVLKLDVQKAYEQDWANKTAIYVALQTVKTVGTGALVQPAGLFFYASLLFGIESVIDDISLEKLAAVNVKPINLNAPNENPQWLPAVFCPDTGNKTLGKSVQQLQGQISKIEQQSWIAGETFARIGISCTSWSIKAKTRYTGSFGGSTKTPILFVSNTVDPRTPIFNGIRAVTLYKNSRLLTIDALGHTSYYAGNTCGFRKITEYFKTGVATTSFCPQEPGPFGVTLSSSVVGGQADLEKRVASLPNTSL